ncbi:unnamed protein product [Paramecium octaurelia]|uniref:Protein kinase domain-containing protein n=1 Tax=Paramecium octaurelia TaxID=43137 RepID=A0A8S1SPF7_PAROT|nr:unnamed protein product [Paramecium octaurelia]
MAIPCIKKLNKIKFGEFLGQLRIYIIKIYQESLFYGDEERKSFYKEISVTRQLQTDLATRFYDLFESPDQIYVIVENLPPYTFQEYVQMNPFFSEERLPRPFLEQLKQLPIFILRKSCIETQNQTNLSLDNWKIQIVLSLTDFKLAEFYDDEGSYLQQRCGTVEYEVPEVLADQNYDLECDVYCVGILLFIHK